MVKWTAHATTQLRHIHDYIAEDSPLYAKRVSDALVRKTFLLAELPCMGHKVPEFDDEAVRELSLYSYRILYEIKITHIDILAVIHKRRDLQAEEIPREL
jgi:plasmid stabilization system protein ParE